MGNKKDEPLPNVCGGPSSAVLVKVEPVMLWHAGTDAGGQEMAWPRPGLKLLEPQWPDLRLGAPMSTGSSRTSLVGGADSFSGWVEQVEPISGGGVPFVRRACHTQR